MADGNCISLHLYTHAITMMLTYWHPLKLETESLAEYWAEKYNIAYVHWYNRNRRMCHFGMPPHMRTSGIQDFLQNWTTFQKLVTSREASPMTLGMLFVFLNIDITNIAHPNTKVRKLRLFRFLWNLISLVRRLQKVYTQIWYIPPAAARTLLRRWGSLNVSL